MICPVDLKANKFSDLNDKIVPFINNINVISVVLSILFISNNNIELTKLIGEVWEHTEA